MPPTILNGKGKRRRIAGNRTGFDREQQPKVLDRRRERAERQSVHPVGDGSRPITPFVGFSPGQAAERGGDPMELPCRPSRSRTGGHPRRVSAVQPTLARLDPPGDQSVPHCPFSSFRKDVAREPRERELRLGSRLPDDDAPPPPAGSGGSASVVIHSRRGVGEDDRNRTSTRMPTITSSMSFTRSGFLG